MMFMICHAWSCICVRVCQKHITGWSQGKFAPPLLCIIHQRHFHDPSVLDHNSRLFPPGKLAALDQDALGVQMAKDHAASLAAAATAAAPTK